MLPFLKFCAAWLTLLVAGTGPGIGHSGDGCGSGTLDGGYPFGDAWEQYVRAKEPVDTAVQGDWKLVGTSFRSTSESGLPNRFFREGVDIDGGVPVVRFISRAEISNPGFLLGNSSQSFALTVRWGQADLTGVYPVSLHTVARDGEKPKTGCLTLESKLYGASGDIFPTDDRRPHGRAQFFCREDVDGLICMVEKFGRLGEVQAVDYGPVVTEGIHGFLRFQRR